MATGVELVFCRGTSARVLEDGPMLLLFWLRGQWRWDSNQCCQPNVAPHASTSEWTGFSWWRGRGLRLKRRTVCNGGTYRCALGQSKGCFALWSFDTFLGVVECTQFPPTRYLIRRRLFLLQFWGAQIAVLLPGHQSISVWSWQGVSRIVLADISSGTMVNKIRFYFFFKVHLGYFEAGATNIVWCIYCRKSSNFHRRYYLGWRE